MGNYKRNSLPQPQEITIFILTDDTFINLNDPLLACIKCVHAIPTDVYQYPSGFPHLLFPGGFFMEKRLFPLQITKKYYNMTK